MSNLSQYARPDDARLAWTGESQEAYERRERNCRDNFPEARLRFWDRVIVWLRTPLW